MPAEDLFLTALGFLLEVLMIIVSPSRHRDAGSGPELRELENFWPQAKKQEELGHPSFSSELPDLLSFVGKCCHRSQGTELGFCDTDPGRRSYKGQA